MHSALTQCNCTNFILETHQLNVVWQQQLHCRDKCFIFLFRLFPFCATEEKKEMTTELEPAKKEKKKRKKELEPAVELVIKIHLQDRPAIISSYFYQFGFQQSRGSLSWLMP